jgi:hypothetical protein
MREMTVADVPLICDPVPGPPMILTVGRALSPADVARLRQLWAEASAGAPNWTKVQVLEAGCRFEPLVGQRTEWPDAEFCAA